MVQIGEKAPDFTAQGLVEGVEKEISLSDFKGKKVAMYFYPRDMTPGCTTQAENLRDNIESLREKGIEVIGISRDSINSHKNFSEKKELPFILVSDEHHTINEEYGVWKEKNMYGKKVFGTQRTTFLLDENLKIINIISRPTLGNHAKEILDGYND